MADALQAERIKKAVLSIGTYEQVSLKTGISVSTLVRITSGKTEPKFNDVSNIALLSGTSLDFLAFGNIQSRINSLENDFKTLHQYDEESMSSLKNIIHNVRHLKNDDINSISRQVKALLFMSMKDENNE